MDFSCYNKLNICTLLAYPSGLRPGAAAGRPLAGRSRRSVWLAEQQSDSRRCSGLSAMPLTARQLVCGLRSKRRLTRGGARGRLRSCRLGGGCSQLPARAAVDGNRRRVTGCSPECGLIATPTKSAARLLLSGGEVSFRR